MKTTFESRDAIVLDDVLDPDELELLWNELHVEPWQFVHADEWVTAWRLGDGEPLRGPAYVSHRTESDRISPAYPTGKAFDRLIGRILSMEDLLAPWVGRRGTDWQYFFIRAYLYPVGTGLSWHRDNKHNATGAFTFYAHPLWNAQWGGELLIADTSTREFEFPAMPLDGREPRVLGSHFDNSVENDRLMSVAIGQYVLPRPGRLVVLSTGLLHCIKKVDPVAGNHVRATLQGVFMHPRKASGACDAGRR